MNGIKRNNNEKGGDDGVASKRRKKKQPKPSHQKQSSSNDGKHDPSVSGFIATGKLLTWLEKKTNEGYPLRV